MEQEPIARTALDEMVESDQDQMLKAMIPYLPSSGQRFLSVYTKVRELRNTMSLFQSSRRTADLQATGFSGTDPLEMLQDIRKCCGGENRRQIDHITSLMATIQMLQIMNSKFGRINYYISPKKLYEETGYIWKGRSKHGNHDQT